MVVSLWVQCTFWSAQKYYIVFTIKQLADDKFLSFIDHNAKTYELNSNLKNKSEWPLPFNPDLIKQTQDVIFSKPTTESFH